MVSVVMPAYNEGAIIEDTVREWYSEVISRIPESELIIVDDCSKDNTWATLTRLAAELPSFRPVKRPQNGGHGRALRYGFEHATQPWVFQTDSDRQHVPSDFWKLWEKKDKYDFVLGTRLSRADGPTRVLITSVMRVTMFVFWGLWIRDANCPFKLMRRDVLNDALNHIPEDSFVPMVMVSILSRRMKFRCLETPVQHLPRRGGEQSLAGLWKWTKVGSRCFRQLAAWRLSTLQAPVRSWNVPVSPESAAGGFGPDNVGKS